MGMGGMTGMGHAAWAINGASMTGDGHAGMAPLTTLELGRSYVLSLRNDTAWSHPMHLHGHFFEVVNGHGTHQPLKHTVMVFPGGKVSVDFTADAPGDWQKPK